MTSLLCKDVTISPFPWKWQTVYPRVPNTNSLTESAKCVVFIECYGLVAYITHNFYAESLLMTALCVCVNSWDMIIQSFIRHNKASSSLRKKIFIERKQVYPEN